MIQSRSIFNSKLKKIERSESAFYKYLAYSHGDKSDSKNLLLQLVLTPTKGGIALVGVDTY